MAINLHISADTAAELIETINGLSTLGRGTVAPAPAAKVAAVEPEALDETPAQTTERRTRRTKAEMDAARAGPQSETNTASTQPSTSSESPAPTKAASDEGSLAAQIREVNETIDQADGGAPTMADVTEALRAYTDVSTGKSSMKEARDLFRKTFITVDGQPVDRVSTLQPKDYAACIALLK